MFEHRPIGYTIFLATLLWLGGQDLYSQITNVEFGKNRIQYHDDFDTWFKYETEHYITHWYGKAKTQAYFVIKLAEKEHESLISVLDHHLSDKIEIIVYDDLTDIKQNNIGTEQMATSQRNRTKVVGKKIFVYYDGDYRQLRTQVREGITEVYLNDMFYGESIQQVIQNAVSLDIPLWFRLGLIAHLGSDWSFEQEYLLSNLLERKEVKNFDDMSLISPRISGRIFWKYLSEKYGYTTISNILYLSRLHKSLNENFKYILGKSLPKLKNDVFSNLSQYKNSKAKQISSQKFRKSKKELIPKIKFNPKKNILACVTNELGKQKVKLFYPETQKTKTLFRKAYKNSFQTTDYNYPIIAWHPNGQLLSVIYEHRDVIYHRKIDIQTKKYNEKPMPPMYKRIYSADYVDQNQLILSANVDGFVDLYTHHPKLHLDTRLTNDIFEEKTPRVVQLFGQKGILFSSNRPPDSLLKHKFQHELPLQNEDIFLLQLQTEKTYRLTNTPESSEWMPVAIDSHTISFLTDRSGLLEVVQRIYTPTASNHRAQPASAKLNYSQKQKQFLDVIKCYDFDKKTNRYALVQQLDATDKIVLPKKLELSAQRKIKRKSQKKPTVRNTDSIHLDTIASLPPELLFVSKYPDAPKTTPEELRLQKSEGSKTDTPDDQSTVQINYSRILGSRLEFRVDYLDMDFSNELLFDGLQSFAGIETESINQPFGILLKMKVKDLFEDYRIEAGVRYPTDFLGSEYYAVLDNNKRKIDKRYAYYRRATSQLERLTNQFAEIKRKQITNLAFVRWKYPFDVYRSVRASFTFRTDQNFRLISDKNTIDERGDLAQRFGLRLEYVFDNSIRQDFNIIRGTRYKFFTELVKKTEISIIKNWKFKPNAGFMTVLGLDARHYQALDRRSIFALRAAAAKSLGSEQILHLLGGMDNWFFARQNQNTPIGATQSQFAYQYLAVQMRGFERNIRNGSSFALVNSELRIPIFQYLKKQRLRSAFFRNFLLTGFFDIGTAWMGSSPFGNNNPLNVITVSNGQNTIRVNYFRDPIVFGYGAGMRFALFGYNFRLDYAYGFESGVRQKPILYFSIGADF